MTRALRGIATASVWSALAAAAPAPMGGLNPSITRGGPMDGMIDVSPLARSEVALRAMPGVRSVVIEPGGWRLAIDERIEAGRFAGRACGVLIGNRIPAGVRVVVTRAGTARPLTAVRCTGRAG